MEGSTVRVRYAPSPTGHPHVGNIRTALFNWLFARQSGGSFIVRIEDTDQARKVEGALESILDSLRWLGMDWDEGPEVGGAHGPYYQSERLDLYRMHVERLLESGHAYRCYCTPERLAAMRAAMAERKESMRSYDRHCRDLSPEEQRKLDSDGAAPVIRFRVPIEGRTTFHDLIRGDITFENSELDDVVLLKSDGYPTYHLANIVDDHTMGITHVLRADEWLSSTPRHVLLYQAFEWAPPFFAHLPMILGPDRAKLSKRHGATAVTEFRDEGYLPEAMLNFMALLGWSLDDRTELFTREDLIRCFSIERIGRTAAIFSHDKLRWMNGVYIRDLGAEELADRLMPFLEWGLPASGKKYLTREYVMRVAPLVQERLSLLTDAARDFAFFFVDELEYDAGMVIGKKLNAEISLRCLQAAADRIEDVPFDAEGLEVALRGLAEEMKLKPGELFNPIRVAVTGRTAAPPLFQTMEVLGRNRCVARIRRAIEKLKASSEAEGPQDASPP